MHVSRDRKAQIRPVAVALVADLERLLLVRVEDADTGSTGYRPLGGTIEFGEYGAETVAREFREELGATVTSIRYLGTVENLFTYDGQQQHELVLLYSGDLLELERFRDSAEIRLRDDPAVAVWVSIEEVLTERVPSYPAAALTHVRALYSG